MICVMYVCYYVLLNLLMFDYIYYVLFDVYIEFVYNRVCFV
jgi:hypothetical protein